MNKLNKLLEAVRNERPPVPADGFVEQVMRHVRREPKLAPAPGPAASFLFDQLNLLFPKLAGAAAGVIVLCVAGDYLAGQSGTPDLAEGAARICAQWFLPGSPILMGGI